MLIYPPPAGEEQVRASPLNQRSCRDSPQNYNLQTLCGNLGLFGPLKYSPHSLLTPPQYQYSVPQLPHREDRPASDQHVDRRSFYTDSH